MDQNDEVLRTAINDVNTVTSALQDLRQKIQNYGEASKRLDMVSDALIKLSETVSLVHQGIVAIVQRADQVYEHIESSRMSVDAMTNSIPMVVERIESSDVTKGLAEFTRMLSEVRDLISNQQGLTNSLQSHINQMSSLTSDTRSILDSMGQQGQLLQVINQAVGQGATKTSEGMALLSTRLLGEFEAVKKELTSLRTGVADSNKFLREQKILLEKAANKKGFSF